MENIWHQVPFLRLLLPFTAGILLAIYVPEPVGNWVWLARPEWLLAGIGLWGLGAGWVPLRHRYRHRNLAGFGILLLLLSLGYQLTVQRIEHLRPDHYTHTQQAELARCVVAKPVMEKERSVKVELEVTDLMIDSVWQPCTGKFLAYIQKSDIALDLRYGDVLVMPARFAEISPPRNPEEFNYKQYLYFHQIYRQGYFRSEEWTQVDADQGNPVIGLTFGWRQTLLSIFRSLDLEQDVLGVVSALVLGYKGDLDQGIRSAYASAGAMHVLAVSGLHVGIIFLIFNRFLQFLGKGKRGRMIRAILLILLLWLYAAITGLSASVMRASTMFSFIILAQASGRQASIYNTLAVSAFVLLLIDPFLIMEVGFQLSYLAVIGIVFLQPRIYRLLAFRSWLGDQIWAITAVSIAAQIATFPLGLLYFHQFPNYFLVSNLIVIPAATLILYLGFAILVVYPFPIVQDVLAWVLNELVQLLNALIAIIERLPYALYQGASISILETWGIYLLVATFSAFLIQRHWRWGRLSLGIAVLLLGYGLFEQHTQLQQKRMVVYAINKTPALDLISGSHSNLISHPEFYTNESRLLFHVRHHWWARGVFEHDFASVDSLEQTDDHPSFVSFGGKRMVWLTPDMATQDFEQQLTVDYVIVSGNPRGKLSELLAPFAYEQVIADGSNSRWQVEHWLQEAQEAEIPFHAVARHGAWIADL